ncbi:hypothetical protein [Actinophytocola sp.]|uniref:hypothetical protein n=1 Tax=Actinophytocola sp. TaxID=1872138 RepID=UPI002ED618B9
MIGSAHLAQHPDARPTESRAGESPVHSELPFWITACVRLQPPRRRNGAAVTGSLANAVFPAVQALIADRLRTAPDVRTELTRDRIARRCGLTDGKSAAWLFDYLELIGFLRVQRHYAVPGRGRSADTFTVYTQPPATYCGPRTHAELERALDDPDRDHAAVLFLDQPARPTDSHRSPTFAAERGDESPTLLPETAGHAENGGSPTFAFEAGDESPTLLAETARRAEGHPSATVPLIDRSSIRKIEGSIEPVPGGTAAPPATGLEADQAAAVRELVSRLGWAEWSRRRTNGRFWLSLAGANEVEAAICAAVARGAVTLDQAAQVAQDALFEARKTPVVFVARAFSSPTLERRILALGAAPLSDNPMPAPDEPDEPTEPAPAGTAVLPACSTCRAAEGETAQYRWVEDDDRRARPCPDCLPN